MLIVRGSRPGRARFRVVWAALAAALILSAAAGSLDGQVTGLQPLRVHPDGRTLVTADGKPFFWLGDTAWFLFAKLDRDEARKYLIDRRNKQFTVIQASLLDFDASQRNALGATPFQGLDPDRPDPVYWAHVDSIVTEARRLGVYMALLPAWARAHVEADSAWVGSLRLDPERAYRYGRWLGERYRDQPHLIWVLGGDARPSKHEVYDRMAQGLADGAAGGDQGRLLMTYHPPGGTHRPPATSTGEFYHDRPWLDFNMIQSGHRVGNRNYQRIAEDWARSPAKPTLDAEPSYEQHPILHNFRYGAFGAWELRRRAYWSLLAGAFGYSYGGNGIWQMDKPGRIFLPTHHSHYWWEALHHEGAGDMQHVRALMESRPLLDPARVPDQGIILSDPGTVDDRVQAARAADRSYWMVYLTSGEPVRLNLSRVAGARAVAWWFNPRDGELYAADGRRTEQPFATLPASGARWFDPPGEPGDGNDWVLVLDDASRGYGLPGRVRPPPARSR